MKLKIWCLCLVSLGISLELDAQKIQVLEQQRFSAEDESVTRPITLPAGVLELLQRDPEIKTLLEAEQVPLNQLPGSWFAASEIRLTSGSEKDLVVIGKGPVQGANVTTFWIFRPRGDGGYESLLNPSAPAHTLAIKNAFSRGYRDLELLSATATMTSRVICKFDGKIYKVTTKSLEPIR